MADGVVSWRHCPAVQQLAKAERGMTGGQMPVAPVGPVGPVGPVVPV